MKNYEVSNITEPVYKSVVTIIVHCSCEELNTWLAQYRHETEKPVEDEYKDCLGLAFSHKNKDGGSSCGQKTQTPTLAVFTGQPSPAPCLAIHCAIAHTHRE